MKHVAAVHSLILAAVFAAGPAAAAGDFVVSDCGDSGGPNQLRAKIGEANVALGGSITFTCGPATIVVGSALPNITSELTIDGDGDISLSGDDKSPILNAFAPLHLIDLTLEHGRATGNGGAIYVSNSSLTTSGVVLQGNTAVNDGGGLYINNSTVTLVDTRFEGNHATSGDGGGAYNFKGVLTLTNVEFTGNTAGSYSGALSNDAGQVTWTGGSITGNSAQTAGAVDSFDRGLLPVSKTELDHVLVQDNEAVGNGGAFYVFSGATLLIKDSTLLSNEAGNDGGGVYTDGSTTLERVLLRSNTAGDSGGGILAEGGTTNVLSSTLFDNSAVLGASVANGSGTVMLANATVAGGSAAQSYSLFQYDLGTIELVSTILERGSLAHNCGVAEEETGVIQSGGFNVSDDDSCELFLDEPSDKASVDAALGPIGEHGGPTATLVPQPGSAVVDAGDNALCPATDQRGVPRPQGETCDIGAVEVAPCNAPIPPLCGDATEDGTVTAPDALKALRTSVGTATCALWLCDYNGVGGVTAADALFILRKSVGQQVTPNCPPQWDCAVVSS